MNRSPSLLRFLTCFIVPGSLLFAAGCRDEDGTAPGADDGRFGDPYDIVLNHAPAGPDEPPAIASDSLVALVTYPGGCTDHDFELDYEADPDTARLWIHHDAYGDDCEALLQDRLALPVPAEALESAIIVLLNPNDPTPFILRWGK